MTLHGQTWDDDSNPENVDVSASIKLKTSGWGLNLMDSRDVAEDIKASLDNLSVEDIERLVKRMQGEEE